MIRIFNKFEQGTPLWFLARLGMPTASRFATVMAKGVGKQESKTRDKYQCELASELITGVPNEAYAYKNHHMERGNEWEHDAILAYELNHPDTVIEHPAFVRNDDIGCGASPDGLIGSAGGVEIKTLLPWLMYRLLRTPGMMTEHEPQVQGSMWVTDRQWWDVVYYSPGFDLCVERIHRDNKYIDEMRKYVITFQDEMAASILAVTGQTMQTWRKRRDDQFVERMEEALTEEVA
jgi:hypothetical protein